MIKKFYSSLAYLAGKIMAQHRWETTGGKLYKYGVDLFILKCFANIRGFFIVYKISGLFFKIFFLKLSDSCGRSLL